MNGVRALSFSFFLSFFGRLIMMFNSIWVAGICTSRQYGALR